MDDDFELSRGGILACFPSCLRHVVLRWQRAHAVVNPERQALFPPPETILTPPRPRPNPLPALAAGPLSPDGLASSGTARLSMRHSGSATPLVREGERQKMDSISKAFASRMHNLHPNASLPATPTSATHPHLRPLSVLQTASSSAIRQNNTSSTPCMKRQGRPMPHRPSVPNLGRSASEPRNLADLGGFAPHQVPPGHVVHTRGGRSRSATTFEGMRGRGRSPGPSTSISPTAMQGGAETLPSVHGDRHAMGRSVSHPGLSSLVMSHTNSEGDTLTSEIEEEDAEVEGSVIQKDLGLKGLYPSTSAGGSGGSIRRKSRGRGSRQRRGMRRVMTG